VKAVHIEPEALDDLAEAAAWYDERRPGLGQRFKVAMRELMEAIGERPEAYPVESDAVRVAFREPFPYKLYFIISGESVRIFAVLHTSRHPATWQAREVPETE
jgi:plasmid stabilization system protein ParE